MKKIEELVKNKKMWIAILAVLLVLITVVVLCVQLSNEGAHRRKKGSYKFIESQYVEWAVPIQSVPYLKYENQVNGNVVSDMFYMLVGTQEVPIFRFDFGDENVGDWLGLLTVGDSKIPVVYTVFVLTDEELSELGDNAAETYYSLIDVFNGLAQDLEEHPDFTKERLLEIGEATKIEMTYWDVTLPSKISVQENNEDGVYEAIFSGEVVGEMVFLYRVSIGEQQTGVFQGYFNIDGVKKPVFVESYELVERSSWNENDYASAYSMMDTVNDVLQQIRTSKYYSEK